MRLLLDTNIFVWSLGFPKRTASVAPMLSDPDNDLVVSAVVAWEIAIKYALGRLVLPEPPASYVPSRVSAIGAKTVTITLEHALGVAVLPPIHADPFDRLLVAQAIALDATLVTGDAVLAGYDCRTLLV